MQISREQEKTVENELESAIHANKDPESFFLFSRFCSFCS